MIDIMNVDDKALFAVGALHVLDLAERLEKKGYTLTPLDLSSMILSGAGKAPALNKTAKSAAS